MKNLKFYDLFAGIGGFHLGLQNIAECVGACEIDKYAAQIYQGHFGYNPLGDITEMDAAKLPDHDILCAGFPCQPFSYAGGRKGFQDERNGNLFQDGIIKIAKTKKPKYLFLENVKGLLSNDRGRTFAKILSTLDEIGYNVEWQCINAKHFVPQSRERVFIIGHLRTESTQPIFSIGESSTGSDKPIQQEQGREKKLVTASCIDANYVSGTGGNRTLLVMLSHTKQNMKQTIQERNDVWTLDTSGNKIAVLYEKTNRVRKLTPLECERLMGFPDRWTEGIPEARRYHCLGNAVVPQVISYIGEKLVKNENVEEKS